jgi:hypothetical protein
VTPGSYAQFVIVSKQPPPIRLGKKAHQLLIEAMNGLEESTGVRKPPSQFCAAALLDFFRLPADEQLNRIYNIDRTVDEIRLAVELKRGLGQTEATSPKRGPDQQRKAGGKLK